MVNERQFFLDYDRAAVAHALGVCPSTLPEKLSSLPADPQLVLFTPLDDEEWEVVRHVLPSLPVPKPDTDFNDRTFIDAVLWWIEAKARGFSWHRLPQELGPQSSREHRHRRWVVLGYWGEISEKLSRDGRLSPDRLRAFQRIAEDAAVRKTSLLARRARMTDAI